MMPAGRIAVLNGPSSSGKTTLARLTRDLLGGHAVALSIDDLYGAVHRERRNDWSLFRSLTRVLFDTAASFGREGFDVVVDTVFERRDCHDLCVATLRPFRVLRVRVDCEASVLARREHARGDRRPGLAAEQALRIHDECSYDLVIDTSSTPSELCASLLATTILAMPDTTRP